MANPPAFERKTIYHGTPAERVLLVVGDLNADGQPEIVLRSKVRRCFSIGVSGIQQAPTTGRIHAKCCFTGTAIGGYVPEMK